MVTVATKLVGLLGYPLKQTFSPQLQNAAYKALGLDYFYFPIEVVREDLAAVVGGIRKMNFAGFHATMPNKVAIMDLLDEVDELAARIGAVNTVVLRDGKLKGYNTDGPAFLAAFREACSLDLATTSFFIFGAGGAARAVATTLAFEGARALYITDVAEEAAVSLVADINARIRPCAERVPYHETQFPRFVDQSQALVNASGVGMHPNTGKSPITKELLHGDLFVADCAYNPAKTQILLDAEAAGCVTMNGKGMVIQQTVRALRLWTGETVSPALLGEIFDQCSLGD